MKRPVSLEKRLATASKAKQAAEMRESGMTMAEVAAVLGYAGPSGVAELLERYWRELPREALENYRDSLLAGLERVKALALDDVHDVNAKVRDAAQRRVIMCIERQARISGIVKAAPPVVVVTQPAVNPVANWPPEMLLQLRELQEKAKRLAAPVLAQGVTVDVESSEGLERDEGDADGG